MNAAARIQSAPLRPPSRATRTRTSDHHWYAGSWTAEEPYAVLTKMPGRSEAGIREARSAARARVLSVVSQKGRPLTAGFEHGLFQPFWADAATTSAARTESVARIPEASRLRECGERRRNDDEDCRNCGGALSRHRPDGAWPAAGREGRGGVGREGGEPAPAGPVGTRGRRGGRAQR